MHKQSYTAPSQARLSTSAKTAQKSDAWERCGADL